MKTVMTGRRVQAWSAIGASVAMILAAASVRAAETQQTPTERATTVSIPAGSLDRSLQAYAEAMNLQLVYAPELVAGLRSRGLSGSYGRREALERLLNESGLTFRFVNERTVTLERVPKSDVRTLGPVKIEGAQQVETPRIGEGVATLGGVRGHQEDETVGYRPMVSTVGSGRPIPIEDNARAVSVLTREQMADQGVNDLGEALNRLPGVAVSGGIYARGQRIESFQVDGGTPLNINDFLKASGSSGPEMGNSFNLAAYERVELVRGVNAAYVGNDSLGGTLNLIRKRPTADSSETFTLTAGSWNR